MNTTIRRTSRPAWMPAPGPLVVAAKAVALTVITALVLFPCLVVVSTSLAPQEEVLDKGGWVVWPDSITFQAYQDILSGGVVTRATLVSAGVTLIGTALSLTCTIAMAYALARPRLPGGRPILLMVLLTFLFTPGMIPSYLVVQSLGLLDTYAALVLPVLVNAFNLIVLRGFFQNIPEDLYEAARIDGAGELRILVRVIAPLSKAAIAVVGLFYAVAYWNSFFHAILYLNDSTMWPIQVVLRQYVLDGAPLAGSIASAETRVNAENSIQMAVLVLAMLPIVIVYPFIQRHFVKGVLTGAIKS
ncbi:putative aldouronate transport system permease protein [Thermocatellispora tengchongensis]|uniref:Putative aldouronate transport system permease protein n=1 Tax=Thermocatellispora tengchongensis TaxID=1073253 RepID=A0A840P8K4_9ACTN|nr:carbohydrate ABC transporter permease [Thermocatellispora tengchongensis]MBB5133770.1 putative aldouronate transport system permease protein [Thermocatellispora tengchongensis]